MTYMDQVHFELTVQNFLEEIMPEQDELEDISDTLHQALENAIQDYINNDDILNYNGYTPRYTLRY